MHKWKSWNENRIFEKKFAFVLNCESDYVTKKHNHWLDAENFETDTHDAYQRHVPSCDIIDLSYSNIGSTKQ